MATANIVLPLLTCVAARTGQHPWLVLVPATCGCSLAFLFPIGKPLSLSIGTTFHFFRSCGVTIYNISRPVFCTRRIVYFFHSPLLMLALSPRDSAKCNCVRHRAINHVGHGNKRSSFDWSCSYAISPCLRDHHAHGSAIQQRKRRKMGPGCLHKQLMKFVAGMVGERGVG